uniref:Uncharacterized protein n=1 Tax=Romanomermis culicivorax TaxID=13658 RepID=A0A915IPX8_ROMCU
MREKNLVSQIGLQKKNCGCVNCVWSIATFLIPCKELQWRSIADKVNAQNPNTCRTKSKWKNLKSKAKKEFSRTTLSRSIFRLNFNCSDKSDGLYSNLFLACDSAYYACSGSKGHKLA